MSSTVDNIRKVVLGKYIYDRCARGEPVSDGELQRRLKTLQTEGKFRSCDVKHIISMCGLKEKQGKCEDDLVADLDYINETFNTCVICTDVLDSEGEGIMPLRPCGHTIHKSCFRDYLRSRGQEAKCPFCMKRVTNPDLQTHKLLTLEEIQALSEERSNLDMEQMQLHDDAISDEAEDEEDQEAIERSRQSHLRRLRAILSNSDETSIPEFLAYCKQMFRVGFPFTIAQLRMSEPDLMRQYDALVSNNYVEDREYLEESIDTVGYLLEGIRNLYQSADLVDDIGYLLEQLEADEWLKSHFWLRLEDEDLTMLQTYIGQIRSAGQEDLAQSMLDRLTPFILESEAGEDDEQREFEEPDESDEHGDFEEEESSDDSEDEHSEDERHVEIEEMGRTPNSTRRFVSRIINDTFRYRTLMTVSGDDVIEMIQQSTVSGEIPPYNEWPNARDLLAGDILNILTVGVSQGRIQDIVIRLIHDAFRLGDILGDSRPSNEISNLVLALLVTGVEKLSEEDSENFVEALHHLDDTRAVNSVEQGILRAMQYYAVRDDLEKFKLVSRAWFGDDMQLLNKVTDFSDWFSDEDEVQEWIYDRFSEV